MIQYMNLERGLGVGMLVGDTIQPVTWREILNIIYGLGSDYIYESEVHPADPPWQDLPQIMWPTRILRKPGQD